MTSQTLTQRSTGEADLDIINARDKSLANTVGAHSIPALGLQYATGPSDNVNVEETYDSVTYTLHGPRSIKAQLKVTRPTGNGRGAVTGGRAHEAKDLTAKDVAKLIRKELKKAKAVGYIPQNLTYSVTSKNAEVGVNISGWESDSYVAREGHLSISRYKSEAFYKLLDRVDELVNQWASSGEVHGMTRRSWTHRVHVQFI